MTAEDLDIAVALAESGIDFQACSDGHGVWFCAGSVVVELWSSVADGGAVCCRACRASAWDHAHACATKAAYSDHFAFAERRSTLDQLMRVLIFHLCQVVP